MFRSPLDHEAAASGGCVLVVLLFAAAPGSAQRLEVDRLEDLAAAAFVDHFGVTNEVYSRRIFRGRAAGWPLLVLGTGSVLGGWLHIVTSDGSNLLTPYLMGLLGAVLITASGILLARARLEVGQRRRWRRARRAAPTLDVRFTGLGTSLRISW
ncbi:MAG: hypothetical protein ACI9KE_005780 [Polyangiales bacterium]|jgi:hypothetical protein